MPEYNYTAESQIPAVIPAGTTYTPVYTPASSTNNYMMLILVVVVVGAVVYMAMKNR
ncbi:hypothetical protein M0R72_06045 [Candidatus Pacearchaeota archaeon]|jgi:hypothetical protein|nr:hypothetical protein [Candidatus Pacearchaeota archaeon]